MLDRVATHFRRPDRLTAPRAGGALSVLGFGRLRMPRATQPRMAALGARVRWQRRLGQDASTDQLQRAAIDSRSAARKPEGRLTVTRWRCEVKMISNRPSSTMSNTRRSRSDAPTTVICASLFAS